jgi:hypothetical protein
MNILGKFVACWMDGFRLWMGYPDALMRCFGRLMASGVRLDRRKARSQTNENDTATHE